MTKKVREKAGQAAATTADGPKEEKLSLLRTLAPGETPDEHMSKLILDPQVRHAFVSYALANTLFKDNRPDSLMMVQDLEKRAADAEAGSTVHASAVLVSQAHTLDAMFTDLAHRALMNAGQFPDAFQRYMTLAFKAQSNCRTTLEALARLHQPREQVVRHVHVYEGGQAVVAEEFHHHAQGAGNAGVAHQAYTQGASGASLPSPNPLRQTVPVAESERAKAVPNARRGQGKRRASGKPERAQTRAQIG